MNPAVVLAAMTAAQQLIEFIIKVRAEAQRDGEWTPEQEAQFDAMMQIKFEQPHWKPE
jgi:hypothetical protein